MNKKVLWIMSGIPGSGKSHWVNSICPIFNGIIISRDAIRFKMLDDKVDHTEYFNKETEVWQEFISQINKAILTHSHIFIDATHLNEGSRNKILNAINITEDILINIVYFDVPLEVCLTRNNQREGWAHVPASVIRRMHSQMVKPTFNEKYYYHRIYTVDENGYEIKSESSQGIVWASPEEQAKCKECLDNDCLGKYSIYRKGECKYVNIPNE